MQVLENSVITSLRAMDAGTRYSSQQYILLLLDTNLENGKVVVERVIEKFYTDSVLSKEDVSIAYDIQSRGSVS